MFKPLALTALLASGLGLGSTAMAAGTPSVDHYFQTMQLSVDAANDLGAKCSASLAKGGSPSRGSCVSFKQAYGIVLDQSDSLNQSMKKANQRLPSNDPRLDKLKTSTAKLNQYADTYYQKGGK